MLPMLPNILLPASHAHIMQPPLLPQGQRLLTMFFGLPNQLLSTRLTV